MTARDYRHRWLLLLPFLWQVGGAPLVNDIAWRPLSLPFPMVWQLVGIIFTTTVIAVVFRLDERAEKAYDEKLD
ncbi:MULTISPECIES: DUF3311 domain-containing protein [Erythrobacter]|uniref:DUF3311 domain-containing protein n=1 Tax=Erythrobacter TaxID=1041 RepID=UPI000C50B734|nr:hypothetical protein [Parvularcula sp.]MCF8882601.1 DUF3311 domain-containing protein [Erythrobacter sp. SN021]